MPLILSILAQVARNKYVWVVGLILSAFVSGYIWGGCSARHKQAEVVTVEVIKYIESGDKIRDRYKRIPKAEKADKEAILSGKISSHSPKE